MSNATGKLSNNINYLQVIEMTDEEQKKMYNAVKKDKLIEMIIEANKHINFLISDRQIVTVRDGGWGDNPPVICSTNNDVE